MKIIVANVFYFIGIIICLGIIIWVVFDFKTWFPKACKNIVNGLMGTRGK